MVVSPHEPPEQAARGRFAVVGPGIRISLVLPGVWFVVAALLAATRGAASEPAPPIAGEREPGSEDCPDTDRLVARVEAILGRKSAADMTPYHVTFSHGAEGFSAAIRSADGTTVRRLQASEPTCAALAHATAVALALLYDSELGASDERPVEKPPETPKAPPPKPPAPRPPRTDESALRVSATFSAGAAALVGVLRPVAPALLGDAGLELGAFRTSLGVLWVPPQTLSLSPGTVHEDLVSGTLRACYVAWRATALRFDLCTGVLAGAISAEARGFDANERHTELFLAFPLEAAFAVRTAIVGWELGASALVLAPPNEFEVAGRGSAYGPEGIAGMFALRVVVEPR
jgi:hypothetical protein